ncbi:DUF3025 domain-containing protein [Ramlibacter ginsenosidimutans]|uniref:DUF3025 domain-containing protein n=1 Tax=Ramlibacter ginsenosidimutans TaxID=502333 RepID=A0A934TNV2_9BURK|nr:DUF3025 domain-containing protein [Ramlibacter ginsenosidimutans]MBK6004495.1 DUF3025 domain-containing protein [Ramlibacter ginsenosidimutans]
MPALDWSAPWLAPWREPGERVAAQVAAGRPQHAALNDAGAGPVRFVLQEELPAGRPYEQYIFETGQCPVRPGLHDFFNALVWMRFPRAKAALNRLQATEIARAGIGARRGPVRDAITVFDENGALLQAPPALWAALQERAWQRLFVELRPLWAQARLWIFGHALLEQLAVPRKGLTAHVWRADAALDSGAAADEWLAAQCTPQALAGKPFTPLPVLGVPGWWPGNEDFSFYDDSLVFRPRKTPEPTPTTTSAGSSRS